MRLRSLVVPAVLVFAVAACGQQETPVGRVLEGTFTVPGDALAPDASTDALGYLLRLPDGYNDEPGRSWPLLVSLHGSGDLDNDSSWVGSIGVPAVLHAGEQPEPFDVIVVAPRAAPGVAWSEQLDAVAALIAEVASSYRVDPAAVVVTGFDTGAAGALALGGARPDLVGAVAVVSSVVEPLAGTELCGLRRVRFVHGRDDLISPLPVLRDWIGAFEERCGLDAELSVVAGGHFATVSEAYRDPDLYAWLTARPAG